MTLALDPVKARVDAWLRWGLAAGLLLLAVVAASYIPRVEHAILSALSGPDSLAFMRLVAAIAGVLSVGLFLMRRRIRAFARTLAVDYERVLGDTAGSIGPCLERSWSLGLLLLMVLFAVGVVVLAVMSPTQYGAFVDEDGPVEYGTAVLFAAGAVLAGLGAFRTPQRLARLIYVLTALFLFVCMGEEISWGQRLLGFEAPEALREMNKQGEANLHDVGSISVFANAFFLLTLITFLWIPSVLGRLPGLPTYLAHYDLPRVHPAVAHIFVVGSALWIFVGLRFGTLGFHPFSLWGHYTQLDDEIFEFVAAYSFFAFTLLDHACRRCEVPAHPADA